MLWVSVTTLDVNAWNSQNILSQNAEKWQYLSSVFSCE